MRKEVIYGPAKSAYTGRITPSFAVVKDHQSWNFEDYLVTLVSSRVVH